MNQEKFEEAYIRANAQLAYVISEGILGTLAKGAGKVAKKAAQSTVGALTGDTARKVVKSVGRGAEAVAKSAGRVAGAGVDAAADQMGNAIKRTASNVYDNSPKPIQRTVDVASPTAKAVGSQLGKEGDKLDDFAAEKAKRVYDKSKTIGKRVLKAGANVARRGVGLNKI